jgi:hypothetical protein
VLGGTFLSRVVVRMRLDCGMSALLEAYGLAASVGKAGKPPIFHWRQAKLTLLVRP